MRRFTIISFFLVSTLTVLGQIDLLENQLANKVKADTSRVNLLNKLAGLHFISSPDKTEKYTSEALQLSEDLNYQLGLAGAYFNKSLIHKLKGQTALQIETLIKSLTLFEEQKDKLMIGTVLSEMGAAYQQQRDTSLAKSHLIRARGYFQELKNKTGEARVLRRLGNYENEKGNQRSSIRYSLQSLAIERELHSKEGIANVMNNIGVDYFELKMYDSALAYMLPSLAMQKEINNLNRLPATYHNI